MISFWDIKIKKIMTFPGLNCFSAWEKSYLMVDLLYVSSMFPKMRIHVNFSGFRLFSIHEKHFFNENCFIQTDFCCSLKFQKGSFAKEKEAEEYFRIRTFALFLENVFFRTFMVSKYGFLLFPFSKPFPRGFEEK